jgi:hypothetical protein
VKNIEELIQKIKKISLERKLKSGFTLGNTSKAYSGKYYITPIRITNKMVSAGVIVYSESEAIKILKKIDGKINYILVDAEKKIPIKYSISGRKFVNIERLARETTKKSELWIYKGNDLALEAIDMFLTYVTKNELRGLGNKKIAIIGGGNLGSKLALRLVERGAKVFLTRRNKLKLKKIVEAINLIKPINTESKVVGLSNNIKAAKNADILIATNDGKKIITEKIIKNLKNNSILMDAGRGTILGRGLALALKKDINVYRVDINAAFEGLTSTLFYLNDVLKKKLGRKILNGEKIVSGGLLAKKNEFVVDNIFKPKFFYGVGDGHGDFIRKIKNNKKLNKKVIAFKKKYKLK